MPPISPIPIISHALFMSKGLKLPTDDGWEQPQNQGPDNPSADQYSDALSPDEMIAIPKVIPPQFMPQNMNKYHMDSCNDVGAKFKKFQDDMLNAVKFAHSMWKLQAKFKDLKVNAVTALGTPGCLDGPKLESFIKMAPSAAVMIGNEGKYRDAVAKGVSDCFEKWQKKVMVPGLPWYPAFAAWPGPMAPPMPNVPMPLIACPSAEMAQIVAPNSMKKAMIDALDSGLKNDDPDKQHEALFESIATALSLAFLMWLPQQQVMLVLGKGPVPSFAPPYVPVGPVVMGDNLPIPGHLMT
ncbi:MAG: hypothetical protein CMH57_02960 [Myxococcales bacterium]|nr:hypothetical protein [Myxococcales bacterium]